MSEGARARLGEVEDEEGEESVEEEDSGETEVADAFANCPEVPQGSNLAPTNQPLVSQSDPCLLKIMEQMATIMGQLSQEAAPRDDPKAPAFKTPSMKAPDSFDGTQAHNLRGFIKYCQMILHNDPANLFSDRKKVLYSTSFLTGKAGKWIEPHLSNISNEDPSYLLNIWKAEQELDNLRMKESGQVSLYISEFRSLIQRSGYWGERAYIDFYGRGLKSRLLDQLASYPGNFETLQELMDITLQLDTRYHERQKEKGIHQEKKPPVIGKQFQASKDKPHSALLNKDNELIGSEK
ncbi:hypothetical protein O181_023927 [Austropuccinia psidii MF-1]|uniref:Retrotransposon gag domain-containing protein n=1 Tax=Austropuccinia psidii MF-1 TaxID=1389203 RepID=A0A9Q3GYG7_9BASI|nr:hypothetical protein [Austropuccinia psidii MF-1]